jgi:hypothetical protein
MNLKMPLQILFANRLPEIIGPDRWVIGQEQNLVEDDGRSDLK